MQYSPLLTPKLRSLLLDTQGSDALRAMAEDLGIVERHAVSEALIYMYGGSADPLPMLTLFDKQITLKMGQANVKKWVDDIMPLLLDGDPLGVDDFATHTLPLDQAPDAYKMFQRKADGAVKVQLKP